MENKMNTEELKKTIKELGGYKAVAEKIGVSDGGLMSSISQGRIGNQTIKSIKMLIEIERLKKREEELQTLKNIILSK